MFADALPAGGFKTTVKEITLDVKDFSTAEGKKAVYSLTFATDRDEKGKFGGDFSVTPLAVSTSLAFEGIPLDAYYPYVAGQLNGPLKGLLDFSGELSFADKFLSADKIAVRFRGLGVDFGRNEGIRFTTASMEGGRYSQKENLLELASVSIAGGNMRFSRDQQGVFSPVTLLRKPDGQVKKREGAVPTESKPFRYRMKDFGAKGLSVSFTDRKTDGDPSFTLRKVNLDLKNLTWPERESMPFRFGAAYGDDGSLKVSGRIRPEPFMLKGEATLRRIPLTDFDPYLPEDINIVLADGSIDTRVSFNLAKGKNGLAGDFKGELGVRNFYCLDAEHEEDLLKWESLQLDEISGSLAPFSLSVKEVSLSKYFAKVVVNKDGTLNLQQLRKPAKKEGGAEKTASPPRVAAASPAPAAPPGSLPLPSRKASGSTRSPSRTA